MRKKAISEGEEEVVLELEEAHLKRQNGSANTNEMLQNGDATSTDDTDTICSLDSVPWNLEGIETIKENGCRLPWAAEENGIQGLHCEGDEEEMNILKEENKKLKAALKEAAEVNKQWRQYHEQRQQYVDRLLATLHELQHPRSSAHSPRQHLEVGGGEQGGTEGEARRLQEALARLQAEHDEHVSLLEMQVRAHRDDWEAERSEKQANQTALAEAQARTALLLQELQLLQAKLADTESKRGLCLRCSGPRASEPNSTSPSTHPSPVPAPSPSPGPNASPTPLQEISQDPLKGWIPISMLQQICFRGSTPDHQTSVAQQQQRSQHHHHHHHHNNHQQQQRPTTLNTTPSNAQGHQLDPNHRGRNGGDSKGSSPRRTPSRDRTPISGEAEDKKKYESMGARPKVLGNAQPQEALANEEELSMEDEKSAKHRARSILASALPVSPVSGGPATPFAVTKSPSTSSMSRGYVPITSTVLTPVNFRPPFVANKRPPGVKQNSLSSSSSTTATNTTTTQIRSGSSPSPSLSPSPSPSIASSTTSSNTTTNSSNSKELLHAGQIQHHVSHMRHMEDAQKVISQDTKAAKSHGRGSKSNQIKTGEVHDRKKVTTTTTTANTTNHITTTTATTTITTSTANTTKSKASHNVFATTTPLPIKATTASTTTTTTTTTTNSPVSSSSHNNKNSSVRHNTTHNQFLQCPGFQPGTVVRAASNLCASSGQQSPGSKAQERSSGGRARNSGQRASHKVVKHPSQASRTTTPDVDEVHQQTGQFITAATTSVITTISTHSSSCHSNTAFTAITVTSSPGPNIPPSPSAYSSTPSSRSSSPGISLTTFGLTSEGRGVPGAIFFALTPEQRGTRSPQPSHASTTSTSCSSTHTHTPDPTIPTHAHDGRPPPGVRSPPTGPNKSTAPSAREGEVVMEGLVRGSGEGRGQHHTPGKLVNSTWVKLMGSREDTNQQTSGLPWRTARAVSGQTLRQARRTPSEESTGDHSDSGSMCSTATFSYTPAVNSAPSSATNSAASSPLPAPGPTQRDDLKTLASKNITSAIMSYELSSKGEATVVAGGGNPPPSSGPGGVETLSQQDLVCPSCQMLFPPHRHMYFLNHFEVCHGPEYADL